MAGPARFTDLWAESTLPLQTPGLFATMWMDLEGVMLSEMSGREGQILYVIIYM